MSDWKKLKIKTLCWMIAFMLLFIAGITAACFIDFTPLIVSKNASEYMAQGDYDSVYRIYQKAGIREQGVDKIAKDIYQKEGYSAAYEYYCDMDLRTRGRMKVTPWVIKEAKAAIKDKDTNAVAYIRWLYNNVERVSWGDENTALQSKYQKQYVELNFLYGKMMIEQGHSEEGEVYILTAMEYGYSDNAKYVASYYSKKGQKCLEDGEYSSALEAFARAPEDKQAVAGAKKAHYHLGIAALEQDNEKEAIEHFQLAGDYEDANQQYLKLMGIDVDESAPVATETKKPSGKQKNDIEWLLANGNYTEALIQLRKQGTPEALRTARDVMAQSMPEYHGLEICDEQLFVRLQDGSLVYFSDTAMTKWKDKMLDAEWYPYTLPKATDYLKWIKDVAAVECAARGYYVCILKTDGSVRLLDLFNRSLVKTDIVDAVDVASHNTGAVALLADGTVELIHSEDFYDGISVSGWKNIVEITANDDAIVGLQRDGTVVFTASEAATKKLEPHFKKWRNIVDVTAGSGCFMAVRADGQVYGIHSTWENNKEEWVEADLSGWKNVKAIAGYGDKYVALLADGSLVSTESGVPALTNVVAATIEKDSIVAILSDGSLIEIVVNDGKKLFGKELLNGFPEAVHPLDSYATPTPVPTATPEPVRDSVVSVSFEQLSTSKNSKSIAQALEDGRPARAINLLEKDNTEDSLRCAYGIKYSLPQVVFWKDAFIALDDQGNPFNLQVGAQEAPIPQDGQWSGLLTITAEDNLLAGLKKDGSVIYTDGTGVTKSSVAKDVLAVDVGTFYVVTLQSNGKVIVEVALPEGEKLPKAYRESAYELIERANEESDVREISVCGTNVVLVYQNGKVSSYRLEADYGVRTATSMYDGYASAIASGEEFLCCDWNGFNYGYNKRLYGVNSSYGQTDDAVATERVFCQLYVDLEVNNERIATVYSYPDDSDRCSSIRSFKNVFHLSHSGDYMFFFTDTNLICFNTTTEETLKTDEMKYYRQDQ